MQPRSLLVAAASGVALLAAPAAARAADVVADTQCVRIVPGQQTATFTATGFTPGQVVQVRADDQLIASGVADPAGNLSRPAFAPSIANANQTRKTFTLTATDGAGVASAPKPLLVSRLGVTLPRRARPASRVRYRAFGFATDRPLYLHIRRGGRTLGRFSLGRATGPCGTASRRLRYMPLRRYRTGTYEYWFSHSRRYSKATRIYGIAIQITRRVVPR